MRTADCGLRTADCGLRIADCGINKAKYHVHNFILTKFQRKFQFFNSKYVFQTQNEVPILINFMNMKMRTAEYGKDRVEGGARPKFKFHGYYNLFKGKKSEKLIYN